MHVNDSNQGCWGPKQQFTNNYSSFIIAFHHSLENIILIYNGWTKNYLSVITNSSFNLQTNLSKHHFTLRCHNDYQHQPCLIRRITVTIICFYQQIQFSHFDLLGRTPSLLYPRFEESINKREKYSTMRSWDARKRK